MGIGVRTGGARTRRRRNPTLYIPGEVGLQATIGTWAAKCRHCRCILGRRWNFARNNMYHEQIVQLTARIVEAERPEKIILFGSYASGTATESSDIDLLVISRSTIPRREREVRLTRQLFGSGVPYDLLVLTPEEMEERLRRNGPFIREILSTGQVVYQRP